MKQRLKDAETSSHRRKRIALKRKAPLEAPKSVQESTEGRAFIVAFAKRVHRYVNETFDNLSALNDECERICDIRYECFAGMLFHLRNILPQYDWKLITNDGYDRRIYCDIRGLRNSDGTIDAGQVIITASEIDLCEITLGFNAVEDMNDHLRPSVQKQYELLLPILEEIQALPVSCFTSIYQERAEQHTPDHNQ